MKKYNYYVSDWISTLSKTDKQFIQNYKFLRRRNYTLEKPKGFTYKFNEKGDQYENNK